MAKRNGDKAKEIELRHQEGALDRERGESFVRDFLMPVLTNLAQTKAGPNAMPIVDENYKMNANPRVLPTETWKRLYVPGYGPAPKTAAQLASRSAGGKAAPASTCAAKLGIAGKGPRPHSSPTARRRRRDWLRASELESPAPRGHFLRTMGQSDRDFVENANPTASIPQALLMNGDLISHRPALALLAALHCTIARAKTPEEKADAI